VPPPRPMRPVADSLVHAWRAATHAFRRFIPGTSSSPPPMSAGPVRKPSVIPSRPPDTGAIDEGWMELTDDEIESTVAARASVPPEDAWQEVTDAELDRPSLSGTTASVGEWTAKAAEVGRARTTLPEAAPRGVRKSAPKKKPDGAQAKPAKKKPEKAQPKTATKKSKKAAKSPSKKKPTRAKR
jgi:hypothetical protein